MKFPSFGLRVGILAQLIFLIIAAMLLVNVVMVKFSERDLINAKVKTGKLLIQAVEQNIVNILLEHGKGLEGLASDPILKGNIFQLLDNGDFSELVIVDHMGKQVFAIGPSGNRRSQSLIFARDSINIGLWSIEYTGITWGVLWINKKDIHISAPFNIQGKSRGGITISSSLDKIYQGLRKSEKWLLFYLLLDTVILTIVGMYLLSRIVVKPIHKLLKMTEEYKDGGIITFFEDTSRNEIGTLSRSMSNMLQKLDENKKELKSHIYSLEKANESLKKAQNEIIRSEKLASVGRLAAGVAHEIGNPIGIILGYLQLINKGNISDEERSDFLGRVETEITRINKTITQLLDYSRPSSGEKKECSAHQIIRDTIEIFKPQPRMDEIKIDLQLEASKDMVLVDPTKIQQVFLNIIMNAADVLFQEIKQGSMGKENELTIKSENLDNNIVIRFIDNGTGIPDEELSSIFDPFYTTKDPGKGTGLGLYVCYSIMEEQGGKITAESSIGEGTSIIISLPIIG